MNNFDFRPFQVFHFKIVTTHCYYYTADWGRLYKLFDVLLDASISSLAMILRENTNTLIGAAILNSGHPYIWARSNKYKLGNMRIAI